MDRSAGGASRSRSSALRVLKAAAAVGDLLRPPRRGVVVLAYHRVGGASRSQVDLPLPIFRHQMELLAASGRATTLDRAVELLLEPSVPSHDPVVVTFDDGYADYADAALPVLVELGLPSTVYLATEFVDQQRPFAGAGAPLSWDALREAVSTGLVTVGSHTHTHALLDRVPLQQAEEELTRSTDLIAEHLQGEARHFAYPKALAPHGRVEEVVRARFVTAAVAGTRPNRYGRTDLHRLARSPVQVSDGVRWFERKLAGGLRLEGAIRELANRRRYLRATQ